MDTGRSLAESIEEVTTAYYRDGGGAETGIATDERLVEALKQAYIAAYARNDDGALDTVKDELAEFGGREPTTNEICEAGETGCGGHIPHVQVAGGIARRGICTRPREGLRYGARPKEWSRYRRGRK